ncbi:uncharacterized protein F4807DRAFT_427368 [Annulohypoxylon truncatum]|uniref:uncharacterized protein n=1 Tax=Annulohypoxylon truncatum TaxID=327061 RepID=UPI002007DDBD|nr:uncharacterized protein F4807DRAFT_427368 [Annulohypoxylon truncatum]KAI1209150.1 hypothetical protein F4807DRAFT_427368 [Annulohypoxylon truncatum]
MTDAPGSDRSLLDRLNALRPSTVNLDPPSKSIAASTIEPAKPLSREDALSERLKSLRNQANGNAHTTGGSGAKEEGGRPTALSNSPQPQPQLESTFKSPDAKTSVPKVPLADEEDDFDSDYDYGTTLSDIEGDMEYIEELIAENEHRRIASLLDELKKPSSDPKDTPGAKANHDDSDDDSEGEHMTREADDFLAQAVDEAELEKANEPPSQPDATPTKGVLSSHNSEPNSPTAPNDASPFNLPTVPSSLQDQPTLPPLTPSQNDDAEDSDDSDDDADFAASISNRMAALRVATPPRDLPSAPTSAVDAFGLPAAPTFAPADRPLPGLVKRQGYTDADQKTWCAVCLEDGTVRCLGCDGDVYCARCWREMHVGPRAGYDERGHRWEKFVRGST